MSIQPGSSDSFGAFARRWRPVLVASARELLGDCPLTEDVAQTVLLKLWADGGWRRLEAPNAYCRRAAHREALRALESRRRSDPLSAIHPHPRSRLPGPEQLAVDQERRTRLLACLRRLPERCALVMTLTLIEGLTHREIARQLGISRKAVEKQVGRGRRHLRRWVAIGPEGDLIWLSSIEDGGGKAA